MSSVAVAWMRDKGAVPCTYTADIGQYDEPDIAAVPGRAKEYGAATRMYGLVDGHLLWAWDIAALGQQLTSHASGRLARAD